MAAQRLLVLPTGTCHLSASRVRRGGSETERVAIPMPMFVIETDDGWVVFDTGCDPLVMKDPEAAWGKLAAAFQVDMTEQDTQLARLESVGLTPDRVAHVVVSHLHMDHAGGVQFFTHSRVWLQKAEMRWAMYPDQVGAGGLVRRDFDRAGLDFHLIEGDAEIVPGVFAILTDGHTPGHQSLVVDLPSGRYVLTGDCAYEHRQLERGVPPPVAIDEVAAARSLARVRGFAIRDQATVIVNHDAEAWKSLRIAPEAEYR